MREPISYPPIPTEKVSSVCVLSVHIYTKAREKLYLLDSCIAWRFLLFVKFSFLAYFGLGGVIWFLFQTKEFHGTEEVMFQHGQVWVGPTTRIVNRAIGTTVGEKSEGGGNYLLYIYILTYTHTHSHF